MDYPTHHPLRRLRRWTAGILAGAGVGTLAVTAVLAAEQANGEIDQGGTSQWTSEDREGAEHNDDDGGTSFGSGVFGFAPAPQPGGSGASHGSTTGS